MNIESSKSRNVLWIMGMAAFLAVIFDYLFIAKAVGVSLILFILILTIATYWLCTRFDYNYRLKTWLLLPIFFFSAMSMFRDNMFLNFLNIVAVVCLSLLVVRQLLQENVSYFRIKDYFLTIILLPIKFALSFFKPLRFLFNRFRDSSASRWRRALVGAVMALPVLIFFTILFASADLAFKQLLDSLVTVQISDNVAQHGFFMVAIFIAMLGAFEYLFKASSNMPVMAPKIMENNDQNTNGREVEVKVFLSLIAFLFLIFIVFQITYLFGGESNIIDRGFTYAEYARKGFWELLFVALITLCILVLADRYTLRTESRKNWFTIPAGIIIAEILIIIGSAFKRLMLYQEAYGMTTLRFYVAGFIIFLTVIFILLALKILANKEERFFAFYSLLTMIVFLAMVNIMNPDALVAKKNLARFERTGKIDAEYLGRLSADAFPTIKNGLQKLPQKDQEIVKSWQAVKRESLLKQRGWQSYNISRNKALGN